jgi:hypothetical protein
MYCMQHDDPNSPLAVYMSEVSRIVPLAKNEEKQLFCERYPNPILSTSADCGKLGA